jgi:hypothetical protein
MLLQQEQPVKETQVVLQLQMVEAVVEALVQPVQMELEAELAEPVVQV